MLFIRLEVKNKIGEKEILDYPEFRFWNNKDADRIEVGDRVEVEFMVRGRDISFKDKDGKTTLRHITELEGLGITYQTISNSDASDENNDLPF